MPRCLRASDNAGIGTRPHSTSFSIRAAWAALVALAALTLAVPASAQGPPGAGGGPPPWAGGKGGGGGTGGGPPAWAGRPGGQSAGPPAHAGGGQASGPSAAAQKAKQAKPGAGLKKARENRARAREQAEKNPAMTCFGLMDELGESFAEAFGTNENKANAFGMCVSQEASRRGEGDDEAPEDEPDGEHEESADCDAPVEDAGAALASFQDDPAAGGECDPAARGGESEETPPADEEPEELEGEPVALTCFTQPGGLAANRRANPFAVCFPAV